MNTDLLFILAETDTPAKGADGGGLFQNLIGSPFFMIVPMILIFYFLIWRPQSQQRKELSNRVSQMKKGDKVVTNGGIHGVINHKGDTTCSIRISDGVFMTIENANISTVIPKGKASDSDKSEDDKKDK